MEEEEEEEQREREKDEGINTGKQGGEGGGHEA